MVFVITFEMYCFLLVKSCLTQFKTAVKTSSSEEMFNCPLEINSSTSLIGSSKNSSVPTTCWKFCKAKQCDLMWSSLQECISVNHNPTRINYGFFVRFDYTHLQNFEFPNNWWDAIVSTETDSMPLSRPAFAGHCLQAVVLEHYQELW